jgi:hypothetical protein
MYVFTLSAEAGGKRISHAVGKIVIKK